MHARDGLTLCPQALSTAKPCPLRSDTIAKELPTKGGIDGTVYGRGVTATDSYLCHHMRRISNAIVTADAESIAAEADKRIRISRSPNL